MKARIHSTAIVEAGVEIGDGAAIWDHVHIRHGTRIGEDCIIGEKTYIAYDVTVGNRVKVNAFVYICTGVTIEDGVMISAGTVFTNDRFPRAATPDLRSLRPSQPDDDTLPGILSHVFRQAAPRVSRKPIVLDADLPMRSEMALSAS